MARWTGGRTWLRVAFAWKPCTVKKESQIFLIYKEIQSGAVAKSYMRNISPYMRRPLVIYDFATAPF
jgi:hypothetical protein